MRFWNKKVILTINVKLKKDLIQLSSTEYAWKYFLFSFYFKKNPFNGISGKKFSFVLYS